MALATYSDLKTSIGTWLDRSDLAGMIPDFIALAETYLNTEPRLRVREAETTTTLVPTAGACALPDDYGGFREVWGDTSPTSEMGFATPDFVRLQYPTSTSSGFPAHFTIIGASLTAYPTSTANIKIIYYRKAAALSDSNTTNWLLTAFPTVYLYASLLQAKIFTRDDEESARWSGALDFALNQIKANDEGVRYARIASRVRGMTP